MCIQLHTPEPINYPPGFNQTIAYNRLNMCTIATCDYDLKHDYLPPLDFRKSYIKPGYDISCINSIVSVCDWF